MKEPTLFTPKQIQEWSTYRLRESPLDHVLCRGLRMTRLVIGHRISLAWGVFTGEYDALRWEEE